MQGPVLMQQNPQQGSPPPNSIIDNDMEESFDADKLTKQSAAANDSGIYSAASNTTFEQSINGDQSDNQSDRSTPERRYVCPICDEMLTSQHKFTLHIRSHNNETEDQDVEKGYTCKICMKVLSSSSSLDRHVLVHSGERPFHCKFCGDTFTTNGNMHRHMRTHSIKSDNYESDGSDSGSSKSIEYNNNKVDSKHGIKRKLEPLEDENNKKRNVDDTDDQPRCFKCSICKREDFTSIANLETHLEDNHPEHPAQCSICNQRFLNYSTLMHHKYMVHEQSSKRPVMGFEDLTFVEFSSQKFPHIARRECELNIHKATGNIRFQCKRCNKAFPCSNSLEIHEKSCLDPPVGINLSKNVCEDDIRRQEFFSRLNLQDNSPEKKISLVQSFRDVPLTKPDTKDLADIPSILSNINVHQQLPSKHHEMKISPVKTPSLDADYKNEQEEESQDFVLEFRKMKLRGEFPCRLCTAVFPNLRALKGHNRTHLNGNNNGTYYCNMCPHSSIDKAALIRHMRTHNGDRPYECALCNYAFTTKANCERHLRNRHSKNTREDVKKSIIYHPSEDPTNEDLNKLTMEKEIKKHHRPCSPIDSNDIAAEKRQCSTTNIPLKTDIPFQIPDLQALKPTKNFPDIFIRNENLKSLKESQLMNGVPPIFSPDFSLSHRLPETSTPPTSRIQVKPFEVLKDRNSTSFGSQSDDEDKLESEPPMEALDLSKKKSDEDEQRVNAEEPQDLTNKPENANIKINPSVYASQILQMCRNGFWPFPLNPFLLPTLPNLKERMQLAGGSMISNELRHLTPPAAGLLGFNGFKMNDINPEPKSESLFPQTSAKRPDVGKPLTLNVDGGFSDSASKMHSPVQQLKPDLIQSPNSVKMVIKNGVLMPKQKQRRYRTERPFFCEHCSARFTLRSNMERHIKQQHPQFWSQRQRNNIGQPGRKPQSVMLKPNYHDLSLPNYESQMHEFDDSKDHSNDKLKYALLNRQQETNKTLHDFKKEDDEDCALVIDENDKLDEPKSDYKMPILEEKLRDYVPDKNMKTEEDLVPVSRLLDNASQQQFKEFFKRDGEEHEGCIGSEEDEEGLVASGSTSEGNVSGTDENRSENEAVTNTAPAKKKSAYSLAPNRVSCPYCSRKFPWTSSLRRHILTHTGQKPFKCSHCPLLFTTKSNCDRHLLRKHGNSATTIITGEGNIPNGVNYLMRNVPERPFKCSSCPSSTFSTYSNLKKHISCKHSTNAQGDDIKAQGYEAGSSEDEKGNHADSKHDWESQIAFTKFPTGNNAEVHPNSQVNNSDLPFKCHLCEGSFAERNEALEHIRDKHASEYDLLMSKNALDTNASTPDDSVQHHEEEENDIRGKFPDYSNRKVICAWCMRRFWSAEDLRRHMRTHTGERPFSCDICRRRFTLKHSMLRHKKKHLTNNSFEQDTTHSDEDGGGTVSPPYIKSEKDDASTRRSEKTDESDTQEGAGDLISNLLGFRDRSIIDKALAASADDAAELLGVKNEIQE